MYAAADEVDAMVVLLPVTSDVLLLLLAVVAEEREPSLNSCSSRDASMIDTGYGCSSWTNAS